MKIKEINQKSVKKISNPELINMHHRIHQYDGLAKTRKLKEEHKHTIIKKHKILVKEMKRRNINHNSPLKYVLYQIIKERNENA